MKGYDKNFLRELKDKNDLKTIVESYVRLEFRGGNYWGRCPFHHEKTPSFCVNQREQFYYCFGCHKSGDVIGFIMEMESMDFNDAVKYLAQKVNMKLPEIEVDDEKYKAQKKHREILLNILKDSARHYVENLHSGKCPSHYEYTVKRGLSKDTLVTFGIGASLDYDDVITFLRNKGYSYEDIYLSGVAGKTEKNGKVKYYDALAGRLIIPVIDQFNNVIAFCGRIIEKKENVGKYVNTRQTEIFDKGKNLFNINNLKKLKNEVGLEGVIMVEGHMDVISLVQAGVKNVVASMGTSLTKDQARTVKRYSEKVYISYDGDFAGQKASIRGLEIFKDEGLDVKVLSLPEGLDPDDVIVKQGVSAYKQLILNAKPLIDFKLDIIGKTFDVNTVDGKRKYVLEAVKVIKESPSFAEQEDLLKTVRDVTGVTLEALKRELEGVKTDDPIKVQPLKEAVTEDKSDKITKASRYVLASYLFYKPFALETNIERIPFFNDVHKEIQRLYVEKKTTGETLLYSDLFELIEGEGIEEVTKIGGLEVSGSSFDESKYFADCLKTLKIENLNKEIDMLNVMFKQSTDTEARKDIAKRLALKISEKNRLS